MFSVVVIKRALSHLEQLVDPLEALVLVEVLRHEFSGMFLGDTALDTARLLASVQRSLAWESLFRMAFLAPSENSGRSRHLNYRSKTAPVTSNQ